MDKRSLYLEAGGNDLLTVAKTLFSPLHWQGGKTAHNLIPAKYILSQVCGTAGSPNSYNHYGSYPSLFMTIVPCLY